MEIVINSIMDIPKEADRAKIYQAVKKGNILLRHGSGLVKETFAALPQCRESQGMTNAQVADFIMKTRLLPIYRIDIRGFYSASNTIGWNRPGTWVEHINRRYLGFYEEGDVWGHIWHEICHMLFFLHQKYFGKTKTVPYVWGYMMRDLFKKFPFEKYEEKEEFLLVGPKIRVLIENGGVFA